MGKLLKKISTPTTFTTPSNPWIEMRRFRVGANDCNQSPLHTGGLIGSDWQFFRWTQSDPPLSSIERQMLSDMCLFTPAVIQSDPIHQKTDGWGCKRIFFWLRYTGSLWKSPNPTALGGMLGCWHTVKRLKSLSLFNYSPKIHLPFDLAQLNVIF